MTKTKEERQRDTAQMQHCSCGNIARFGETKCGACINMETEEREAEEEARKQERRNDFIDALMEKIGEDPDMWLF